VSCPPVARPPGHRLARDPHPPALSPPPPTDLFPVPNPLALHGSTRAAARRASLPLESHRLPASQPASPFIIPYLPLPARLSVLRRVLSVSDRSSPSQLGLSFVLITPGTTSASAILAALVPKPASPSTHCGRNIAHPHYVKIRQSLGPPAHGISNCPPFQYSWTIAHPARMARQ